MGQINFKKGISLITLIITIIIVVILAGTIIFLFSNNNPITAAKQASFKQTVKGYQDELSLFMMNKTLKQNGEIDLSQENYSGMVGNNSIYVPITSMKEKDVQNFIVKDGKLLYSGIDENELKWAMEIGLEVDIKTGEFAKEAYYYDSLEGNTVSNNKSKGMSPISGTFILPYTYTNWTDSQWEDEIADWKKLGIEYLIIGDTAQKDSGVWKSYYPSNIASSMYYDALTPLFERCKSNNIKIFLGMGMDSIWWNLNLSNEQDGTKFLNLCNEISPFIGEIYNKYYNNYSDVFYGFYFVPEMSNPSYLDVNESRSIAVNSLSNGINVLINKINELNPNLKFIMSQYLNIKDDSTWTTKSTENIQAFWTELINATNFRSGDILCPQDSIGAKGMTLDKLLEYTLAYKRAIYSSNKKDIKLWSNVELFASPDSEQYSNKPDGVEYTGMATIDRIINQINIVSPCVERIVLFSYSNYLSRLNSVEGFLNTYTDYLKYKKLDSEKPKAPNKVKTSLINISGNNYLQVSYSGMYDNYGISRVNIYKNGKFYTYRVSSRSDENKEDFPLAPQSFFDKNFNLSSDIATYDIEVIDCAGNVSDKFTFTLDSSKLPNNTELDMAYYGPNITQAPAGGTLYKDKNGNVAPVPKGFTVSTLDTENTVENGLVIKDSNGNEFVWIPVIYGKYKNYYRDSNRKTLDSTLPESITSETYQISKYNGFYIGRYESSYDYNNGVPRVAVKKSLNATTTAGMFISREEYNGYLWNYVLSDEAKKYSEEMSDSYHYDSTIKTGLQTGRQWDAILKWIGDSNISNANSFGNYKTSKWPANLGNYESGVLKASGSNDNWKIKNIYDFAGNLSEWTNETYNSEYVIHDTAFDNANAVLTFYWPNSTYYYSNIGFRVVLYLK